MSDSDSDTPKKKKKKDKSKKRAEPAKRKGSGSDSELSSGDDSPKKFSKSKRRSSGHDSDSDNEKKRKKKTSESEKKSKSQIKEKYQELDRNQLKEWLQENGSKRVELTAKLKERDIVSFSGLMKLKRADIDSVAECLSDDEDQQEFKSGVAKAKANIEAQQKLCEKLEKYMDKSSPNLDKYKRVLEDINDCDFIHIDVKMVYDKGKKKFKKLYEEELKNAKKELQQQRKEEERREKERKERKKRLQKEEEERKLREEEERRKKREERKRKEELQKAMDELMQATKKADTVVEHTDRDLESRLRDVESKAHRMEDEKEKKMAELKNKIVRRKRDLLMKKRFEKLNQERAKLEEALHAPEPDTKMLEELANQRMKEKPYVKVDFTPETVGWNGPKGDGPTAWGDEENATLHTFFIDTKSEDKHICRTRKNPRKIRMKLNPFALGSMRIAYYMEDLDLRVRCVSKEAILEDKEANDMRYFYNDVESHLVSKFIADKFMLNGSLFLPKSVDFILMSILEFPISERRPAGRNIFAYEPYLEGDYKKFTNNAAYRHEVEFRTMEAFSHFSFHFTKGKLMVVDLQGIEHYVLTDPQIHSDEGAEELKTSYFGQGNRNKVGFTDFFEGHKCNTLCHGLGLKPHASQKDQSHGKDRKIIDDGRTEIRDWKKPASEVRKNVLGLCPCGQLIKNMTAQQFVSRCRGDIVHCVDCKTKLEAAVTPEQKCSCGDNFIYNRYERLLQNISLETRCLKCVGASEKAQFDMPYLAKFGAATVLR